MASTQTELYINNTYNNEIKDYIISSGGTIVFQRDNVIMASEISEEQYRELLNNQHISKIDILPLKRYKNQGIKNNKINKR